MHPLSYRCIYRFSGSLTRLTLYLALILLGCRAEEPPVTAVSNTIEPVLIPTKIESPINTPIPDPVTPARQQVIAPTPTGTPRPLISLVVPTRWSDTAEQAIATLAPSSNWDWRIVTAGKPQIELSQGTAQLALVPGEDGRIIHQSPLVVAVPFTTNWEETTIIQAQDILINGHNLAVITPWAEMGPELKAIRIDGRHPTDADYPLQSSWSLINAPGFETAVDELAPILSAQMAESIVHIAAVGDMMLARELGAVIERGNLAFPFAEVNGLLQTADLTIGNLESALGTLGQPAEKSYPFEAPPAAAKALTQAGFDIITLANNHAMDFGTDAFQQGIDLLHEQNIAVIGAGNNAAEAHHPFITEVNGLQIAFFGYVNVTVEARTNFDTRSWAATKDTPGLAWGDPATIHRDVSAVSPQVDLTVVVLHSGLEYVEEPSEDQAAAAQAAIDAGADLVIGHHAHILQGVEFYNEGVIVYGLGNFAFQIEGDPNTAVLNVWLDNDGVRQIELVPAIIKQSGRPRLAETDEAAEILQRVYFLTTLLNPKNPTK